MSEQERPPGPGATGGRAERMAEVMAWHGMARYADPDDLAGYVRPAPADDPRDPQEPPAVP